jgi:alpha-1,6-mannosyltransferase
MASWHAWFRLARALDNQQRNTYSLGSYLLVITACQFHLPFYASRMLPNTFALVVVLHAYTEWIQGNVTGAASCLVAATAVFRCDILLLLFTVGLTWLIRGEVSVLKAIQVGILAGIVSLVLTVPIDSILWNQWVMWPEGQVFYYNAILGKSSDWGTSPWHWYLSNAIPKAMLMTLFLVPLSVVRIPTFRFDATWLPFLLPIAGFVGLYSCLGHKEMRFLFPIMPIMNLAAAVGMTRLHQWAFPAKNKSSSLIAKLAFFAGVGSILITLLGSMIFLQVSRHNYPGGDALELVTTYLEKTHDGDSATRVWIDVASTMSGVSLFGQRHAMYRTGVKTWDKGGYEKDNEAQSFDDYTHLLSEVQNVPGFHVVEIAQGHPRIDKRRASIVTEDAIFVLERNDWGPSS